MNVLMELYIFRVLNSLTPYDFNSYKYLNKPAFLTEVDCLYPSNKPLYKIIKQEHVKLHK